VSCDWARASRGINNNHSTAAENDTTHDGIRVPRVIAG
jgi:hypothetical protein